jgi:stage III sporulation protein AF
MIQWLSDWLKEIILVILLATFVDLLLPNSSMQRYVKVVISLFILMTLLSPILTIFQSNIDLDQAVSGMRQNEIKSAKLKSIQEINREAEILSASNVEQTTRMVEVQIAEMMQSGLEKIMDDPLYQIQQVDVQTKFSEKLNSPEITVVQVLLRSNIEESAKTEDKGQTETYTMEPIEPVLIELEWEQTSEKEVNSNHGQEADQLKKEQLEMRITEVLKRDWELYSSQITVDWR